MVGRFINRHTEENKTNDCQFGNRFVLVPAMPGNQWIAYCLALVYQSMRALGFYDVYDIEESISQILQDEQGGNLVCQMVVR
jgi:hypothetical protein